MHEAKRPRLTGSFSPASPPYHLAKGIEQHTQRQGGFQQPHTPTSPPTQSMGSLPTNAPSTTSTVNTQLADDTPASSAAGPAFNKSGESDEDVLRGDAVGAGPRLGADSVREESSHMRTDHERIQDGLKLVAGGSYDEIQQYLLDVPVGPLYSVCQKPHVQPNPHPSQNLFTTYNLNSIASSVARFDPVTGTKTNKLRKTYKGYYKDLGISGKEKVVDGNGDFETLMRWPQEEYRNQRMGTERAIGRGLEQDFEARLAKALHIPMPGAKLPPAEETQWRETLGTDEPVRGAPANAQQVHHQQQYQQNVGQKKSAPMVGAVGTSNPRTPNMNGRPERPGKKRRYDDTSFSGYGEGYEDEGPDAGSDDEALSSRRKRMKA